MHYKLTIMRQPNGSQHVSELGWQNSMGTERQKPRNLGCPKLAICANCLGKRQLLSIATLGRTFAIWFGHSWGLLGCMSEPSDGFLDVMSSEIAIAAFSSEPAFEDSRKCACDPISARIECPHAAKRTTG